MAGDFAVGETPQGDFVVVGASLANLPLRLPGLLPDGLRVARGDGAVLVPRDVMLAWVESWAEQRIQQYLRGDGL